MGEVRMYVKRVQPNQEKQLLGTQFQKWFEREWGTHATKTFSIKDVDFLNGVKSVFEETMSIANINFILDMIDKDTKVEVWGKSE